MWKTKDGKNTYCSVKCAAGTKLTHVKGDTHVCKQETVNCQALRDKYDLIPGYSWGSTPSNVRGTWSVNGCNNKVKKVNCKFMASHYGIVAGKTWGKAPKNIQDHWGKLKCNPAPACKGVGNLKSGQKIWKKANNMWKTKDGKNTYCSVKCAAGTKLTHVKGDTHFCKQETVNCQALRDKYDLIPGYSWGSTPSNVRGTWSVNGCNNKVKKVNCKFMASHYGIVAGKTWGKAPKNIQDHWGKLKCNPAPACKGVGNLKSGQEIWKKANNMWKTKDGKNTYCSVKCAAGTKLTHVKGDTHVCKPA